MEILNKEVREATEFPQLAHKYDIFGVPKTVINEAVFIDGAVPEDAFLENVLKAIASPKAEA
jgi:predicted DsbA family dithiol-disulfide isomerase